MIKHGKTTLVIARILKPFLICWDSWGVANLVCIMGTGKDQLSNRSKVLYFQQRPKNKNLRTSLSPQMSRLNSWKQICGQTLRVCRQLKVNMVNCKTKVTNKDTYILLLRINAMCVWTNCATE